MKVAPVYRALADRDVCDQMLVHAGQHYDPEMSDVFLDQLSLPRPDIRLGVGSGTHAQQTARALVAVEEVLLEHRPDLLVVAGDVNSTFAAALAARKLNIQCAHIEAGLRSGDGTMPEEINRILTDQICALLLTHSPEAIENLQREGIPRSLIHLVGNTMIDSVLEHVERALARAPWSALGVERGAYGLVTLHRPALVDDSERLATTIDQLIGLSKLMPIVFPVHPRTLDRMKSLELESRIAHDALILTQPFGYTTFLGLEASAAYVLTDSGGVQEETSALGVRCFTLRDATERPITVRRGTNVLLGAAPEAIAEIPALLAKALPSLKPIPRWDGRAGERAAAVIARHLGVADAPLVREPRLRRGNPRFPA